MTATYGAFNRKINFNPYSTKYALPGERATKKQQVEGTTRRSILHSLTYHELPVAIDHKIETFLPKEEALQASNPLRKDYLSFTVYSLKQMVAAGTISADTAWSLFQGEWEQINEVEEENFEGMRRAFAGKVLGELEKDLEGGLIGTLNKELYTDRSGQVDLLRFEFLARAGEAGLVQFERYAGWAKTLYFEPVTCERMPEMVRQEYRKALWLEMRSIEEQVGLRGLNKDIGMFQLNFKIAEYDQDDTRKVTGAICLFRNEVSEQSGRSLDSSIKPEVGHWMFSALQFNDLWVAELMDRMNKVAYTDKVDAVTENLPPVVRTFLEGGDFLQSREKRLGDAEAAYPTYPDKFPWRRRWSAEDHEVAEYVETLIRKSIRKAFEGGQIEGRDIFKTYRKMGAYIALLNLEGKTKREILGKIKTLDINEMEAYYGNYKQRMTQPLEVLLKNKAASVRKSAAQHLIWLKGLEEGSPEYKRLYAYKFAGKFIFGKEKTELESLGEMALPALEAALEDELFANRVCAAQYLLEFKQPPKDSEEYKRLYAYVVVDKRKEEEILALGKAAIPALESDYIYCKRINLNSLLLRIAPTRYLKVMLGVLGRGVIKKAKSFFVAVMGKITLEKKIEVDEDFFDYL